LAVLRALLRIKTAFGFILKIFLVILDVCLLDITGKNVARHFRKWNAHL
jgi:hypothetical protein